MQSCHLASTLRTRVTGVPAPHDSLEFGRHLRRCRRYPPAWLVDLASPAIYAALLFQRLVYAPHDILEFRRLLRRCRGYPPAWLVVLASPAICSAAVSAVGLRRGCLRRTIFYLFKSEIYFILILPYTVWSC